MARARFGVLGALRSARHSALLLTRGLSVVLAARLVSLGPAVAAEPPPGPAPEETLEQVWARSRTVGYQDAAMCSPQAMLHGCPQPTSTDPSLGPKYQQCVEQYMLGYQEGTRDPDRDLYLRQASQKGADDARNCAPMTNAPSMRCQAEWERAYRAAYGLPGERCRKEREQQRAQQQPAQEELKDAIADTSAVKSVETPSASIEPPKPEAAEQPPAPSGKKAARAGGGSGPSALPLLLGLGAGAAVGAYYLGQGLAASTTAAKSCSTWGASHCSSASDARKDSSGYCHCCLQVCSGSCYCMGCTSGCSGSSLMCVDGTCVFRIGELP